MSSEKNKEQPLRISATYVKLTKSISCLWSISTKKLCDLVFSHGETLLSAILDSCILLPAKNLVHCPVRLGTYALDLLFHNPLQIGSKGARAKKRMKRSIRNADEKGRGPQTTTIPLDSFSRSNKSLGAHEQCIFSFAKCLVHARCSSSISQISTGLPGFRQLRGKVCEGTMEHLKKEADKR